MITMKVYIVILKNAYIMIPTNRYMVISKKAYILLTLTDLEGGRLRESTRNVVDLSGNNVTPLW